MRFKKKPWIHPECYDDITQAVDGLHSRGTRRRRYSYCRRIKMRRFGQGTAVELCSGVLSSGALGSVLVRRSRDLY